MRNHVILLGIFSLFAAAVHCGETPGPRIISLYAAHTEVLLRLGARDNIIGVSRQESYNGPETANWNPPVFSFRDDVEKFLAARPDIVLIRPQHAASGPHMKQALERAGITVTALQVTDAAGLYRYWRELAALVGREAEAEVMIGDFAAGIERIRREGAALPRRPGVFLEAIHREVKTFTPDSLPYWLVEVAGGRNIAADAVAAGPGVMIAEFGPERILGRAEEVEVFVAQAGAMNRGSVEGILGRDIYGVLRAVREGRVHVMEEGVLARPTPSLLEGAGLLAGWLREAAEKR